MNASSRQEFLEWLGSSTPRPASLKQHPMLGQELQVVTFRSTYSGEKQEDRRVTTYLHDANSVTSQVVASKLHRPVLDIDLGVKVFPSSTPGHHHLYIDKMMPWADYELLLRALAVVEIIEPGYLEASLERKHTSVRLPWVKKSNAF